MKIRYYFMSIAMVAAALTGFTSCSDDDDVVAPAELQLPEETIRVRIGDEYRVPVATIPITGGGNYSAYSLTPEICGVETDDNGIQYLVGYKNGLTDIVVSDALGNFKRIPVSVYTTDHMLLNAESYDLSIILGQSAAINDCEVISGNGGYTISSDNDNLTCSIDSETGAITMSAKAKAADYTAIVTVTDISGLTANISISVNTLFVPYTADELADIMSVDEEFVDYNGSRISYFNNYKNNPNSTSYGNMALTDTDGRSVIGYSCLRDSWGYKFYYNMQISYPSGTGVGEEIDGFYIYGNGSFNREPEQYSGRVKILADNSEKTVVIWWNTDMEAEKIDRGYVVYIK